MEFSQSQDIIKGDNKAQVAYCIVISSSDNFPFEQKKVDEDDECTGCY